MIDHGAMRFLYLAPDQWSQKEDSLWHILILDGFLLKQKGLPEF